MKARNLSTAVLLLSVFFLSVLACSLTNTIMESSEEDIPEPASETDETGETEEVEEADVSYLSSDVIMVSNTTTYLDKSGIWKIHGLITNTANTSVGLIKLEAVLSDGSLSDPVFAAPTGLAPGETIPFRIGLPLSVTLVDQFEVQVIRVQQASMEPAQLEVVSTSLHEAENGIVTLSGEISNPSGSGADLNTLEAALFDENGDLITSAACQVCPRSIPSGGQVPVQFLFYGHPVEQEIASQEVYISSVVNPGLETFDAAVLEPVHSYKDEASWVHVLGQVRNDSEAILDLTLLATLYDSEGQVAAADRTNPSIRSLNPGESSPFEFRFLDTGIQIEDWQIQVDPRLTRIVETPSFELAAEGEQVTPAEFQWTFTGSVVNETEETLEVVLIVAGVRDPSTGKLAGLAQELRMGEVPSGSSIDYSITVTTDTGIDQAGLEAFTILRGR